MRADVLIFKRGLCKSRSQALRYIEQGVVYADEKQVTKPSEQLDEQCDIVITEKEKYVSRGGLKLECALREFNVNVNGKVCLDIGASTGGFTHCLLLNGAEKVYAVDCGHDQLDDSLLCDSRVVSLEGVNARTVSPALIGQSVPVVVMDVSFISQSLIYPAIVSVLEENGVLISLVKPQFEVGKAFLNKNGIVKNDKARENCLEKLRSDALSVGLKMVNIVTSPIKGGDGNIEYFALFVKGERL